MESEQLVENQLIFERLRLMECYVLGWICDKLSTTSEIYDFFPEFEDISILQLRKMASLVLVQRNVFTLQKIINKNHNVMIPTSVGSVIWEYAYYHRRNYFQFDIWMGETGKKQIKFELNIETKKNMKKTRIISSKK